MQCVVLKLMMLGVVSIGPLTSTRDVIGTIEDHWLVSTHGMPSTQGRRRKVLYVPAYSVSSLHG